jgi:predicted transcriptional regulator
MSTKEPRAEILIRVQPAVKRKLAKLAANNRRSMAAEAAHAVDKHLEAEKEKTA